MFRASIVAVLCLTAAVIVYIVLFTGGSGSGGSFAVGNLHFVYSTSREGIMPERLDYLIVTDGVPDASALSFAGGKGHGTFRYRDGTTVDFPIRTGQTVWVGADRKARAEQSSFSIGDIQALAKRRDEVQFRASSLEELRTSIAQLRRRSNTNR